MAERLSKGALSMNPALTKAAQVLVVAVFAFILGGYSFLLSGACAEFRGGGWAWTALAGSILGLAFGAFRIVRDAGKPDM